MPGPIPLSHDHAEPSLKVRSVTQRQETHVRSWHCALPCFLSWRDDAEKPSCHKNVLVLTALEPQRGCKLCTVTWQWLQVLTRGLKAAIFLLCCARELVRTSLSLCAWSEGHAADLQLVQWNALTKWHITSLFFFVFRVSITCYKI